MKFALVAYAILTGDVHSFVLDQHLTYDDCRAAVEQGVKAAEIVPGVSIDLSDAPLVCKLEDAPDVQIAAYR